MDTVQSLVVDAVRKYSPATVEILSRVGKGCPDLLVGVDGRNLLWEIKSPGGKLQPIQE